MTKLAKDRKQWAKWLQSYGAAKLFDAFMHNAQGAEGKCIFCGHAIFLDIREGGGVPDWRTEYGDYGCEMSPDTCEDGTGGHIPRRDGSRG